MKRYRSALMAGLLALAVAVCDDDGTVVQPPPVVNVSPPDVTVTVPPAPPPPVAPLAAMITPPSAEVGVDGMVDFAVGTSGGAGDASWTCTSSDTAVATVETTDTGCRATAVAGGGVTITAAVTKGSESTNVAANLTVSTTADAFVLVTDVSGDDDTDESGLKGTVTATISVERGNQTFERLSLNVDGMEVDAQEFGTAAADDAEQSTHEFKLSFNSAAYDEHGDHVDVDYMNGEHSIQALLKIMGRDGALMSNVMLVEFDNDDKLMASMSGLGEGAANESTGQMWYGGPDASVEITALPVVYSEGGVSSVTLLAFCGDDAMTDSEAPFMFEVDCDDYTTSDMDGDKPEFTVGGDDIKVSASAVYLDFEAPMAPHFHPNPNGREDGWVNLAVDFLGEQKSSNKDGWLVYNDADEAGVGGYIPQLYVSTATPSVVGGALAAGVVAGVPALPPGGTKKDAVCAVVTAEDLLGNESKHPKADKGCAMAEDYETAVAALKTAREADDPDEEDIADALGDIPAGIRAGLDIMPPTIDFSPASPKENGSSLKNFQVQVADAGTSSTGRSGLHTVPVLSNVVARDADNDVFCGDHKDYKVVGGGKEQVNGECKLYGGMTFDDPLATTDKLSSGSETGYYTFTALSQDKAGNKSEQIMRTTVNDTEAPELGLIVGGYDKGAWSLTATLTDNLSLKAYWAEAFDEITGVGTGNILILPREGGMAVDEYNSAELTQSYLTTFTVQVFRALQPAGTGETTDDLALAADATLASIQVVGVDHGAVFVSATASERKGYGIGSGPASLGSAAMLDPFGYGDRRTQTGTAEEPATAEAQTTQETAAKAWNEAELTYARNQVFQDFEVEDDESDHDALELRATIKGLSYVEAVAGVWDNDETADVDEGETSMLGMEGLGSNPVSRVDFYAAVALKDVSSGGGTGNRVPPVVDGKGVEALKFLGSSSVAGAEDYKCTAADRAPSTASDAVDCRKYTWGLDMSAAAFLEVVDGNPEAGDAADDGYDIVAIAVNSDGVAISAVANVDVDD